MGTPHTSIRRRQGMRRWSHPLYLPVQDLNSVDSGAARADPAVSLGAWTG